MGKVFLSYSPGLSPSYGARSFKAEQVRTQNLTDYSPEREPDSKANWRCFALRSGKSSDNDDYRTAIICLGSVSGSYSL